MTTPLVVTADDVGLAPGMTRGALESHDRGIVTACSVAANGAALAEAIPDLLARPQLAVGVHWVLTGERPLSPPAEIRSLVGGDGNFLPDFRAFARRYARGGIRSAEVELELRRQTELLRARGLELVHANSHQHLHLLARLMPVAVRLAREFGIGALRVVREPDPGWQLPRGLEMRWLNRIGSAARRALPAGLATCDQTVGIRQAGRLDAAGLARALRSAAPGSQSVELVCHPGTDDAALAARYRWGYAWERETAALTDPGAAALVAGLGFTLSGKFR